MIHQEVLPRPPQHPVRPQDRPGLGIDLPPTSPDPLTPHPLLPHPAARDRAIDPRLNLQIIQTRCMSNDLRSHDVIVTPDRALWTLRVTGSRRASKPILYWDWRSTSSPTEQSGGPVIVSWPPVMSSGRQTCHCRCLLSSILSFAVIQAYDPDIFSHPGMKLGHRITLVMAACLLLRWTADIWLRIPSCLLAILSLLHHNPKSSHHLPGWKKKSVARKPVILFSIISAVIAVTSSTSTLSWFGLTSRGRACYFR